MAYGIVHYFPGANNRRISFFPLITFVHFQKKEINHPDFYRAALSDFTR
jgi:hypothetical protein